MGIHHVDAREPHGVCDLQNLEAPLKLPVQSCGECISAKCRMWYGNYATGLWICRSGLLLLSSVLLRFGSNKDVTADSRNELPPEGR